MALVTSKEMFAKALKSDHAVGAFNVNNMEIIQGIVDAAKIRGFRTAPVLVEIAASRSSASSSLAPSTLMAWISGFSMWLSYRHRYGR